MKESGVIKLYTIFCRRIFLNQDVLKWRGQLTPFQENVSEGLIQSSRQAGANLSSCGNRSWKDRNDLSSSS